MLKMTIDNEEVLSNNDISIKEEILSPSSTILNNVYPKSWEEDKDYVSRFYYPKDYSKLNIQNFSTQPEEAGTTIQINGSATLTDVDTTKESRVLRLLGQTSQVQYAGNQLINFASPTSVKLTTTSFTNNVLSVVGSAGSYPNATWDILDLVKNNGGKTLKIKFDNISVTGGVGGIVQLVVTNNGSTSYVGMVNRSGQVATSYNIPSDTSNLTKCDFTIYTSSSGSATAETITMTKPLVYFNNNDTYEPYVGGTASPNPSYPQPVNVVSGDNEINICGKNLVGELVENSAAWSNGNIVARNGTSRTDYILIQPNTSYYIQHTMGNNVAFVGWWYDKNKQSISNLSIGGDYDVSGAVVSPNNAKYLIVNFFNTTITTNPPMISIGSTATTYEPYIGSSYPLYLGVENLIDNTMTSQTLNNLTFTINSDKSIKVQGTASARTEPTLWQNTGLTLKANTNYYNNSNMVIYFQGTYNGQTGQYFVLNEGATYNRPYDYIIQKVYIRIESGTTIDTTLYPQIGLYKTSGYTPYGTTPIELCKIGTYQDYIYKDNGSWYLHKEIGKVVLKGSESGWYKTSDTSASVFVISNQFNDRDTTQNASSISNYFKYQFANSEGKFYFGSTTNTAFCMATTYTLETFKTWLSTHNTEVYYVLATPTNTPIEDTTLIEQLEALSS